MATPTVEALNTATRGLNAQIARDSRGYPTLIITQAATGDEGIYYPAQSIDMYGTPAIEVFRDSLNKAFPPSDQPTKVVGLDKRH